MKLYYAPAVCSLSPHIALIEANLDFELEKVDLRKKITAKGHDFYQINSKGNVPALWLDEEVLLTEGVAIVQWIADLAPEAKLAPPNGTLARAQLQEVLNYISTEVHKGFCPLMNPKASLDAKQAGLENMQNKWGWLNTHLTNKVFLMGEDFSVADGYLFNVLSWWVVTLKKSLAEWPNLDRFYTRVLTRPAVQQALSNEGLPSVLL